MARRFAYFIGGIAIAVPLVACGGAVTDSSASAGNAGNAGTAGGGGDGGAGGTKPTPKPRDPTPRPKPDPKKSSAPLADCTLAQSWWQPKSFTTYGSPQIAVSPDGGEFALIAQKYQAQVFDLTDGSPIEKQSFLAITPDWKRVARFEDKSVVITDWTTGTVFAEVPLFGAAYNSAVVFGSTGNELFSRSCDYDPNGSTFVIGRYDLTTLSSTKSVFAGTECEGNWVDDALMQATPNGKLVFSIPPSGSLRVFDAASGSITDADAFLGTPVPEDVWTASPIVDFELDGAGERVAVVTSDAKLRVWSIGALEPLSPAVEVAIVGINKNTYMPSSESPMAWSADGSLLAHVGTDERLTFRDLISNQTVRVIETPPVTEPYEGDGLVAVRILGNDAVLAAFEHGTGLYQCEPL